MDENISEAQSGEQRPTRGAVASKTYIVSAVVGCTKEKIRVLKKKLGRKRKN